EIDIWDTGRTSLIWVKMPELASAEAEIWLTWGDPSWTNQPAYTTNGSTWSENYVGVWHMNGTNLVDSTRNGNEGTGQDVTVDTGRIGHGLVFDGSGSKVDITQAHKLPIYNNATSNRFTFEGWAKGPDQTANRYFSEGNSVDDDPYYSFLTKPGSGGTPGHGRIAIKDDGAVWLAYAETGQVEFDDTWHHLAWADNNGTLDHWVDGVQDDTVFDYTRGTLTLNNTTFGALQRTSLIKEFNGVLDEFRISDGIRSSNWIYTAWFNAASNSDYLCFGEVDQVAPVDITDQSLISITCTPAAVVTVTVDYEGTENLDLTIYYGLSDGGENASAWDTYISTNNVTDGVQTSTLVDISLDETNYFRARITVSNQTVWASQTVSFAATDTDGDGVSDVEELCEGSVPTNINSHLARNCQQIV
ncbi:MAG: LamG-like jellyroll fold domain-containing protein, partial [Verrucomicrobiota bacterium]